MVAGVNHQEEIALEKFSNVVADLNKDKETLLRFLRARDLNIGKAEQMLRQSAKWFEENDVESYRSWLPPKALSDDFRFQFLGHDIHGFPVLYIPLGSWNIRDRIQDGYGDETLKFRFYLLEAIFMNIVEKSKKKQLVVVIDTATLSFYKIAHMATMNMVVKTCQDLDANYPEILKTAFIINSAWVFPYAMAIVKPWLAPKTLAKVQMFDTDKSKWIKALKETIPLDILPRDILN